MPNSLPVVATGYTLHIYGPQTNQRKACDYLARLVRPDGTASMEWSLMCSPRQLSREVSALLESIDAMLDGKATPPVYYGTPHTSPEGTQRSVTEQPTTSVYA